MYVKSVLRTMGTHMLGAGGGAGACFPGKSLNSNTSNGATCNLEVQYVTFSWSQKPMLLL